MTPTATLTRIHLNLAERTVRRDLADRNQLHKTLMRLTPGTPSPHPRRDAGLLFRLDPDAHQPTLLIQSTQPPRLHRLPTRYGTAETRDLTPMFNALQPGLRLRYRITAAPVRCVPGPAYGQRPDGTLLRRRGTPTPLHGEEALAWWQRRATGAGLDLEDASLTPCTFECPPRSAHPDA
ncbi:type I-E CRISPR-associated protein Cas6/Cse3/CasE, partial [Streptomyces sp. NPDC047085]|uniref:type I-E CRISPR-associated protein Cas6/Cse3/CasE n=1 Tax=Streptomyces sp. NPDC047085 TaxID=3155140 RepID=UPI0033FE99AE